MKKVLVFLLLQSIVFSSMSQNTVVIPFYRTKGGLININIKINNYKKVFIFDTGASGVVISSEFFMEMLNHGYVKKSDIVGKTSVVIADGSVQEAYIAEVQSIKIGSFVIDDCYILIMPDANAPLLVGQDVIGQFGKVTIDNNTNEILLEESNHIQHSKVLQLKEMKFIPCSTSEIKDISKLESIIGNEVRILSITEEKNVPPPSRSVANISSGITIRYFDNDDYDVAVFIKKKIKNDPTYNDQNIHLQNMLPFYNYKAISGLVEIWIKK